MDLEDGPNATSPVDLELRDDGASLSLHVGDQHVGPLSHDRLLAELVTSVSRLALDADAGHLHLLCAGLALGERGVLISAPSGTGKSTLAAALARRGWTYVSDETLALSPSTAAARGFPKPLSLKPGSGDHVGGLEHARVTLGGRDGTDGWWMVAAGAIPAPVDDELHPTLVVLLRRPSPAPSGMPSTIDPVHPADAVVALMEQTMDPVRFGPDALWVLARLAGRSRCVRLTVGHPDEASTLLERVIGDEPQAHAVRRMRPDATVRPTGWRVATTAASVVVADRAVVHDTNGGAIVALDDAGTAVWRALHGEPAAWWEPETMRSAEVDAFLGQLADLQLVLRPSGTARSGP